MLDRSYLQIVPYLPFSLRSLITSLPDEQMSQLEELRFQPDQPIICRFHHTEAFVNSGGGFSAEASAPGLRILNAEEMRKTVLLMADSSLYALEEELRRGYITLPGGHRAGMTGRAVLEHGAVKTIKEISSLNIRVARHVPDVARPLLPQLLDDRGHVLTTLIISPPRAGKTTMLRDLARLLADGIDVTPHWVGIVDERSELAAVRQAAPQLPVGLRSNVLDGCPKAEGMMMLLRSMSPEVLVADEIGRPEDALALAEATHAGVSVLTSAHGRDEAEIMLRPVMAGLLANHAFQRIVVLSRRNGPGTIEKVYEP